MKPIVEPQLQIPQVPMYPREVPVIRPNIPVVQPPQVRPGIPIIHPPIPIFEVRPPNLLPQKPEISLVTPPVPEIPRLTIPTISPIMSPRTQPAAPPPSPIITLPNIPEVLPPTAVTPVILPTIAAPKITPPITPLNNPIITPGRTTLRLPNIAIPEVITPFTRPLTIESGALPPALNLSESVILPPLPPEIPIPPGPVILGPRGTSMVPRQLTLGPNLRIVKSSEFPLVPQGPSTSSEPNINVEYYKKLEEAKGLANEISDNITDILERVTPADATMIINNIDYQLNLDIQTKINDVPHPAPEQLENKIEVQEALAKAFSENPQNLSGHITYVPEDFVYVKKLGQGTFGDVFQFKNLKDGSSIVVKQLRKFGRPGTTTNRAEVRNEVEILHSLVPYCGQYILCYIGYFETAQYYYIITEFLGNYITLKDYISNEKGKQSNDKTSLIINNVINGLKEIHSHGIAHRDIKPGNIMINPDTLDIKYIDFGVSCMGDKCNSEEIVGTPLYTSPELEDDIIRRRQGQPLIPFTYDLWMKTDIWSLGMSIFELITGVSYYYAYFGLIYLPELYKNNPRQIEELSDPNYVNRTIDYIEEKVLIYDTGPLVIEPFLRPNKVEFTPILEPMLERDPNIRSLPY